MSKIEVEEDPIHYRGDGKIRARMAMQSMMFNAHTKLSPQGIYWWGCAFKYLWRFLWKDGIKDLDKCINCIQYVKSEMEGVDTKCRRTQGIKAPQEKENWQIY